MKSYDLAFSCGYGCGVTQALREAGLQFSSYPFDWTATPSVRAAAEMVAADFAHWMDRGDLQLIDVRRGGMNKHVYLDRRTGFGFVHDFSSFKTFDESYPAELAKYERRAARLLRDLAASKRVLAVGVEWPILQRAPIEDLVAARRLLSGRFQGVEFDILYVFCEPGRAEVAEVDAADGVTVASCDYRKFEDGELSHEMDNRALARYLAANVSVPDPRSEEEKAKYSADWKQQDAARWKGRNWLESFVNRSRYRRYRRLEKFLVKKGLVPPERPLWLIPGTTIP